jgi:signal transduction histidine kinase
VARDWTAKALAAGIDLGYEGEEQLRVLGHPLLLREALNNLIDNALHYAGTGATVTVRVYLTAPAWQRWWWKTMAQGAPEHTWATCSRASGAAQTRPAAAAWACLSSTKLPCATAAQTWQSP